MLANSVLLDDDDIVICRSKGDLKAALVIDGDPLIAKSLAMILGAEAFTVETASTGADGVSLAIEGCFDVVILSADLPDMSGLEAMSRLRAAEVKAAVVFASVTRATAAAAATIHLSDCT